MKSTFFLTAATLIFSAAQAQVTTSTSSDTTATSSDTTTLGNTGTNNAGMNTGTNMNTGTGVNTTTTDTSRKLNNYGSYSTRDSIAAKYKLLPMPGALTLEKTFPILGTYQLNTATAASNAGGTTSTTAAASGQVSGTTTGTDVTAPSVTITLDSASKGIVWVEGLQQGRLKAYLKKSPATYRIVAQKSGSGTAIPEGTMILDTTTNTLNIALGAPYNEVDPAAIFALSNGGTAVDNTAEVKVKTKNAKTKSKVTFITATKVDAAQQLQEAQTPGAASGTTQQNGQQAQQDQQQ